MATCNNRKIALPHFYPIVDTGFLQKAHGDPLEIARILAAAATRLVQFRHKGEYTREILEQARAVTRIVHEAGGQVVINDRADIALLVGADGVHVGQNDLPPAAVRKLVGDKLIVGLSTHGEDQLLAGDRESVDYLTLGPIFGTASKANPDPVVGVEELGRLRRVTRKPLVAIGGITRQNAQSVWDAGADSVAVISDLAGVDASASIAAWAGIAAGRETEAH